MYLAIWLFPFRVLSKFGRRKEANNSITGLEITGLKITGRQCDQKSSVGVQLVASERLTFSFVNL